MKYVFFINPTAGKGKGVARLTPEIKKYFGTRNDYEIIVTEFAGDAKEKARKIAESGEEAVLFACGGDGTFYEVLNGAYGHDNISLGVVPCGSGNDFLKFFGSGQSFADISAQVEGVSLPMDVIKTDEGYSMNLCNLGMDAAVADQMHLFKGIPFVTGSMAYKMALLKVFLGKIGQRVKVWIDGKLIGTFDCLFAICANGPVYGGGYKCAPNANPMDGKLNWLIIEKISKLKIPKFIKLYEQGLHEKIPFCRSGECESMRIECEKPEPLSLDGEIVHRKNISFELIRGAVKFVLPRGVFELFCDKTVPAVES